MGYHLPVKRAVCVGIVFALSMHACTELFLCWGSITHRPGRNREKKDDETGACLHRRDFGYGFLGCVGTQSSLWSRLFPSVPACRDETFPRTQDGEIPVYDALREIFPAHVNTRPHVGLRFTTAIVYEV